MSKIITIEMVGPKILRIFVQLQISYMEIFIISIAFIGLAFIALGVNIFFTKNGKFPETEIGKNAHMRELGISCTKCDERKNWNKAQKREKVISLPKNLGIDFSQIR